MRRLLLVGLAAVALPALAQPAQSPSPRPPPTREAPVPSSRDEKSMAAWVAAHIDLGEYEFVDSTSTRAYFLSAPDPDLAKPLMRANRRAELFAPQSSRLGFRYRSTVSLIELDCANTRMRILGTDAFEGSNLQGERRNVEEQDPQWRYPRENAIAERELYLACAARAEMIAGAPKPAPAASLLR
jgi:hypothetical protein